MGLIIGLVSSLVAGAINGSFAVPMKKISNWEWENTWFIYALVALLILPFVTAFMSVSGLVDIYTRVENSVILTTFLTGFLYGVGSVTFGLGLHVTGLSLGYSIIIGLASVTGSLVPMLFLSPESILKTGGLILLLAMAVSVKCVTLCGIAGSLRAKSQPGNNNTRNATDENHSAFFATIKPRTGSLNLIRFMSTCLMV